MAKSLQEQLVKSGLAKPKQAAKARREKTADNQAARRKGQQSADEQALEQRVAADKAAKRERDRQLNAEHNARRATREQADAVAQIIAVNQIEAGGKDAQTTAYNYSIENCVHRIHVDADQRRGLAEGRLAVVRHRNRAALVPREVGQRLMKMVPAQVWLVTGGDEPADADDPYADFPVPDDLMW